MRHLWEKVAAMRRAQAIGNEELQVIMAKLENLAAGIRLDVTGDRSPYLNVWRTWMVM